MKGTVSISAFLLSLLFAASTALAVDPGKAGEMKDKSATVEEKGTTGGSAAIVGESEALTSEHKVMSSDELVGKKIENLQGEELGEIDSLLLDPSTGQIAFVTVKTGEADSKVVPFKAFDVSEEQIQLDIDKQKLASAPSLSDEASIVQFDRESSEFFGVSPHWEEESAIESGTEVETESGSERIELKDTD